MLHTSRRFYRPRRDFYPVCHCATDEFRLYTARSHPIRESASLETLNDAEFVDFVA